ncbi:hypothetical protein A3A01_00050 [Candidatus Nomurabacteria bacterium RIFCSPLOWO2_01_FULL_39_17]|uniref:Phosphatidic acid phosphatase type 2/haloperoxidase domain-containing protein n=1 Tax=Candidatus Nomurabacteria bacterium RIFCSPLOWO2_01_FULL_39_17 TaxID=1801770 RepID=A0A1F6WUY0_9BACT|nr:MAG: hypothetical protein A3A01_00050 [Candidatus Nomurabacteria bacterium RIFCSPLOWO2_01_FULL_39_17]
MNNQIFYFFYNLAHKSEFFDKLVIFFADTFPYLVILLALIFLLIHHKVLLSKNPLREFAQKWRGILFVFFSGGFAWLIAKIMKIMIHAPRPFAVLPDVQALLSETGLAFPSGHATFFSALAVSIFFSYKKAGYVFMFFAFLIGLARIIAGIHFPLDILGGFVLGSVIAYFLKNI